MNVEALPDKMIEPAPWIEDFEMLGDKQNKGKPPPKVSGTEHKWREEKKKPKIIIRIPWFPKPKPKP